MEMEAMKQFGRFLSGADTFTGIQESWMVIQLWALSTLFSNSFQFISFALFGICLEINFLQNVS